MKKIIKEITGTGIMQITMPDERWYVKQIGETFKYVPSVTWITGYYPKSKWFLKWYAEHGYDDAEAIKQAAGDKGSKVHYAVTDLINGKEVTMEDKYVNPTTGLMEELTVEEYECLMAFTAWYQDTKPTIVANELVVFHDELNYAGTIDIMYHAADGLHLADFKTGQQVYTEHEIQVSAYKWALMPNPDKAQDVKLEIIQLGYKRNKKGYKVTPVEDKMELFLAARKIWQNETAGIEPFQKDFPVSLKLGGKDDKTIEQTKGI
jgi:hypothetical protein